MAKRRADVVEPADGGRLVDVGTGEDQGQGIRDPVLLLVPPHEGGRRDDPPGRGHRAGLPGLRRRRRRTPRRSRRRARRRGPTRPPDRARAGPARARYHQVTAGIHAPSRSPTATSEARTRGAKERASARSCRSRWTIASPSHDRSSTGRSPSRTRRVRAAYAPSSRTAGSGEARSSTRERRVVSGMDGSCHR